MVNIQAENYYEAASDGILENNAVQSKFKINPVHENRFARLATFTLPRLEKASIPTGIQISYLKFLDCKAPVIFNSFS